MKSNNKAQDLKKSDNLKKGDDLKKADDKSDKKEEKSLFQITRETVESIVVAFILALTFRTYIAEAFMIPTGSMANELMGRHKDIYCSGCGFRFKVAATDEVDTRTGRRIEGKSVGCVVCPNCRVCIDLSLEEVKGRKWPSYDGDRIIVGKYPYRMSKPSRWDVFVFMYPGDTQTNYIKRLVGLPNETLRIHNGDVFTRPLDSTEESDFQITRKPADKVLAVMQNVYDDDKRNLDFQAKTNWPRRWIAAHGSVWESQKERSEYHCQASPAGKVNWLMYQHVIPTHDVLLHYFTGTKPTKQADVRPSLITDMNAYNYVKMHNSNFDLRQIPPDSIRQGIHWTGDLIIESDITPSAKTGKAHLQLIKGGFAFTATINLENQTAQLSIKDLNAVEDQNEIKALSAWQPKASIKIEAGKKTSLRFANVDQTLYLWINDKLVEFDSPTEYSALDNTLPTKDDLNPARIGMEGVETKVECIKLYRDLYYIAANPSMHSPINDFVDGILPYNESDPEDMEDFYRNSTRWGRFASLQSIQFDLHEGQYFALGDNSSNSKDSRLWWDDPDQEIDFFVSEELLIGKAQFVFWPHPFNGFIPNVSDMRKVK